MAKYILILLLFSSCRSVKNLSKTLNKSLERKDSTAKIESVSVKTDTSKFNSEIVIEYSDTDAMNKLRDGSELDWQPFVVDVSSDPLPSVHTTQKVKRIIIKTNVFHNLKDSSVLVSEGTVKTVSKTVDAKKEVHKKVTSYWWIILLLIPVIYLLYQKYKTKIYGIFQ